MSFIDQNLLIGRVQYLEKINSKPGLPGVHKEIINKVTELIQNGQLQTFMQVEAVFTHLIEQTNNHPHKIDESAKDILEFLS